MLRIAVVEDEDLYADTILSYIERFKKEQNLEIKVKRFTDGDEITEKYQADYDIILMDIQMQFMNGMAAAEEIRKVDEDVVLMFITNMTQYAIKGYEVNATDYIVKPIEYFPFSTKLQRAISRVKKKENVYITIAEGAGKRKVDLDSLLYVESMGHNLLYHLKGKTKPLESRGVMKELQEALEPHGFFRCGKGFLVNLKHVDGVKSGYALIDGEQIPVGRAIRQDFMDALAEYMGESV